MCTPCDSHGPSDYHMILIRHLDYIVSVTARCMPNDLKAQCHVVDMDNIDDAEHASANF